MSGTGTIVRDRDVNRIVKVLQEDPVLIRDAERFCRGLDLKGADLEMFRSSLRDYNEILPWALRTWMSRAGDNATLENLINILKGENFNRTAKRLAEESTRSYHNVRRVQTENLLETVDVRFEVPGPFVDFAGRTNYFDKLHKSIIEQTTDNSTIITAKTTTLVSGLGGIGKTTLAMHYARIFQRSGFYSNVIWINSESLTTRNESLSRLIDYLKLNTTESNPLNLGTTSLMELIYDKFKGQQKTLFIFDNVEDFESIKQYLPDIKPNVRNPFILLTSRKRISNNRVDRIELDVFEEDESVEFFTKYLTLMTDVEKVYAKEISTMLNHLPLAIRQAGAYIRTQKEELETSNEREMRKYIRQFEENSKKLLSYEYWKHTGDNYGRTTFITWKITMQKIKEQNEMSDYLMNLISYLTPDNIPIFLLVYLNDNFFPDHARRPEITSVFTVNSLELRLDIIEDAVSLLTAYSMICRQENSISVHRLVQHVIREQHIDEAYLDDCVNFVEAVLATHNNRNDSLCVLQGESVLAYTKKSVCHGKYDKFIQLIQARLNSAVEEQIKHVQKLFTDGLIGEAFRTSQEYRHGWSRSPSNYKLYLEKYVKFLCESSRTQDEAARRRIADEIIITLNGNDELVVEFMIAGPHWELGNFMCLNHQSDFNHVMQTAFAKLKTDSREGNLWKNIRTTYRVVSWILYGFRLLLKTDECVEVIRIFNPYFSHNDTPHGDDHFFLLDSMREQIFDNAKEQNSKLVPELMHLSMAIYDSFATQRLNKQSSMSDVASTVIYCLISMKMEDETSIFVQKHLGCIENACQIFDNHTAIMCLLEFSELLLLVGRDGQNIKNVALVQGCKSAIEKFYTLSNKFFNHEYSNSLRALRVLTNVRLLLKLSIDVPFLSSVLIPNSSLSDEVIKNNQRIFLEITNDLIAFDCQIEALSNLELLENCIMKHSDLNDLAILINTMRLASKIKVTRGCLRDAPAKLTDASRMLLRYSSYNHPSELKGIVKNEIQELEDKINGINRNEDVN